MSSKRAAQSAIIIGTVILLTLSMYQFHPARQAGMSIMDLEKIAFSKKPSANATPPMEARQISASELMERPLPTDLTRITKIFHQSWMNSTLPTKFEGWSHSCRMQHPDWEWVLWTDEDNHKLMERYVPWFMDEYDALLGEILRADVARNAYMHVFGGVYADLDTECLRPYDDLFATNGVSTVSYVDATRFVDSSKQANTSGRQPNKKDKSHEGISLSAKIPGHAEPKRNLFLGRLGTDSEGSDRNSIPNAWMASTPGHPFWLLPLEVCAKRLAGGNDWWPELVTGPMALMDTIEMYREQYQEGNERKLDEHYAESGWATLYKQPIHEIRTLPPHTIEILPFYSIYPWSWNRDGKMFETECSALLPTFHPTRCKLILGVEHWPSYSITYWSHTWTPEGHDPENMKKLQVPNKVKSEEEAEGGALSETTTLEE